MQIATLILSGLSLAASTATLVVVVVALKRGERMGHEIKAQADSKKKEFQRLVADL